jgi:hypothetical protein
MRGLFTSTVGVMLSCCLIAASSAYSSDFTIRLDDEGKPFSVIPPRDQSSLGTCYAHAAANLVDAYRFSHGDYRTDFFTSPEAAAITSAARSFHLSTLDGGFATDVINTLRETGSCSDSVFKAAFGGDEAPVNIAVLSNFHSAFQKQKNPEKKAKTLKIIQLLLSRSTKLPALSDRQLEYFLSYPFAVFMSYLIRPICENDSFIPRLPPVVEAHTLSAWLTREDEPSKGILDVIESNLKRGNAVGASFCYEIIEDSKAKAVLSWVTQAKLLGRRLEWRFPKPGCELHEAVVIGLREQGGRQQILLRNSRGVECGQYNSAWKCENGSLWIDADAFAANTQRLFWFKD